MMANILQIMNLLVIFDDFYNQAHIYADKSLG